MTNEELNRALTVLCEGDKTAFEKIYQEFHIPIFTIILRMTQNRPLAEDILQDFFVKLYCSPPKSISNPRAYIFQMARNLTIDEMRKQPKAISIEDCESPTQSPWSYHNICLDLDSALGQLTLEERQIITLHINGSLKFREIASMTNIPLGTVLWKYQKAIKGLRILLEGGTL